MAKRCGDHLTNEMEALSVDDDPWKELELDDNIRRQLSKIENDYESIFSWSIQQLIGVNQNLMVNLIDKIREKQEMIIAKDDEFNLNRFYLQLVACYELYNSKSYKESYLEIENVVKFMETCKFDESNERYSDAYHHIAKVTNAYIALTLEIDSEKLLKDVKPIVSFNRAEKAAVCSVKARIFMEYPPKGNDIALKFADQALTLDPTEPELILIWLKAKGRVRRYYEQFKMPDDEEMDAAELLSSTKSKPRLLIQASKVYMEAAFVNKLKYNKEESNKLYMLASVITKKAIELAKDDTKLLYSCLLTCIDYPKELLSKSTMDNIISKLSNVNNTRVDQVLGKYYLKHLKDYEKAKIHLSRGVAAGHFGSSLLLIRVECLLQSVNKFPFVQTLNMMYNVHISPKRRLIILSQILMYYTYCEYNPKELMDYLKLYLDQDINDTFKKQHLIFTCPKFEVNGFKAKEFLNILTLNVKNLLNHKWSIEEKMITDNTFDRFDKILKLNIDGNQLNDHNKKIEVYSNRRYLYNEPYNNGKKESWRKQKIDLSDNESNKNQQHQSASKCINEDKPVEKHCILEGDPSTTQHKVFGNNIKLPVRQSIESTNTLNDSISYESKHKKFENELSSPGNLHVVSLNSNSINRPSNSKIYGRDIDRYGVNKSSWRNQQVDPQNHDTIFEIFNNRGMNSEHSREYYNADYLKNQRGGNPRRGNHALSGETQKKDFDDTES